MKYLRLGSAGMQVSKLCLGGMTYGSPSWRDWVLDEAASRPFIKQALDAGINFFDTADMVAAERGVPPAQVAMAWVASRAGVTAPIIGATKPHHLEDAVAGIELVLSAAEVALLEQPYRPRPVAGHE